MATASIERSPDRLVAFDVSNGCELLLSHGLARDAVAASAAIRGVLPPVSMDDRIYVLPTQSPCRPLEGAPKTALDAALHGLGLLIGSRLEADIARVHATGLEHSIALLHAARLLARTALARDGQGRHLRVAT